MQTFKEWLKNHDESFHDYLYNEDWKKWAKNLALGASLLGAGGGIGCNKENPQTCPPAIQQIDKIPTDLNAPISYEKLVDLAVQHGMSRRMAQRTSPNILRMYILKRQGHQFQPSSSNVSPPTRPGQTRTIDGRVEPLIAGQVTPYEDL
jgi:hypothetical protein